MQDQAPNPWDALTNDERAATVQAMGSFGGGFVTALATAFYRADSANARKLEAAFPEMVAKYGPRSHFQRQGAA
jgi:hypothetical protein